MAKKRETYVGGGPVWTIQYRVGSNEVTYYASEWCAEAAIKLFRREVKEGVINSVTRLTDSSGKLIFVNYEEVA